MAKTEILAIYYLSSTMDIIYQYYKKIKSNPTPNKSQQTNYQFIYQVN